MLISILKRFENVRLVTSAGRPCARTEVDRTCPYCSCCFVIVEFEPSRYLLQFYKQTIEQFCPAGTTVWDCRYYVTLTTYSQNRNHKPSLSFTSTFRYPGTRYPSNRTNVSKYQIRLPISLYRILHYQAETR